MQEKEGRGHRKGEKERRGDGRKVRREEIGDEERKGKEAEKRGNREGRR